MPLTSSPSATTRVNCASHLGKRKARSVVKDHRQTSEDDLTLVALTLTLQEPFGIVGKVVVIAGCGRATELLAEAFVVHGAKVYVASAEASIAPTATALTAAGSGSCIVIHADLATTSGRAALATHISESEETVDLLINTPACAAAQPEVSGPAEEQSSRKKRKVTSDIVRFTILLSKLHSEQPKWTVNRCAAMHEVSQSTLRRNYEQALQMETPGTSNDVSDPESSSNSVLDIGPSPDPTDTAPVSHSATDPVDFSDFNGFSPPHQEEINDEREAEMATSVPHGSESPSGSACGEPVESDPSDGPCMCRCHCSRSDDLLSDEHLQIPELLDSFVELLDFPDRICENQPSPGVRCGNKKCRHEHVGRSSVEDLMQYFSKTTDTLDVCMYTITSSKVRLQVLLWRYVLLVLAHACHSCSFQVEEKILELHRRPSVRVQIIVDSKMPKRSESRIRYLEGKDASEDRQLTMRYQSTNMIRSRPSVFCFG